MNIEPLNPSPQNRFSQKLVEELLMQIYKAMGLKLRQPNNEHFEQSYNESNMEPNR